MAERLVELHVLLGAASVLLTRQDRVAFSNDYSSSLVSAGLLVTVTLIYIGSTPDPCSIGFNSTCLLNVHQIQPERRTCSEWFGRNAKVFVSNS